MPWDPLRAMKYFGGAALAGHFVDEGDGLGLGGQHVVVAVLVHQLQHFPGAGHRQLCVAETDKSADIQVVRDLTDGQIALQTGHGDGINRHDSKLLFRHGRHMAVCRHSMVALHETAANHRSTRANRTVSAAFRRFLPFSPWPASASLHLKSQKTPEDPSLTGAKQLCRSRSVPGRGKDRRRVLAASPRVLPLYGRITARQSCACLCRSTVYIILAARKKSRFRRNFTRKSGHALKYESTGCFVKNISNKPPQSDGFLL